MYTAPGRDAPFLVCTQFICIHTQIINRTASKLNFIPPSV